ncbi:sugar efflux transporter [Budvicia diplopodorum]|uniref:sugar efflux transporter n=1 Tax=Budvicia diplopodorum TaxID=1119056 RepID=UPI001FECE251|nr:sugar efflux transporter [Budvicia diplopodorum]
MRMFSVSFRKMADVTSLAFLFIAFLTGMASALQTPTLSLFLTTEVQTRPFLVGLFYTSSAIIGIVISQIIASYSDRSGDRKKLIIQCCLIGALGCILYAFNRNYFVLLTIGVVFLTFGSTATPQLFALAREHADKNGREAVMFSSILRAQISLAWVVGPPLAFVLALEYGFTIMYIAAAASFAICALIVWHTLPAMPKIKTANASSVQAPRQHRRDILLLFVVCSLMWTCNGMYFINMPLYLIQELQLPKKLVGIMMGAAAGLEIPVMLIAGYYAKRFGKRFLMGLAIASGLIFYLGLMVFTHTGLLLGLQLLNAVFIGILASIGMLYFQDLMPGQAGSATTLFTNTVRVGWIIGGLVAGLVTEVWQYHSVFYIAALMCIVAIVSLFRIKYP